MTTRYDVAVAECADAPPALVAEWVAFLCAMDDLHERLATTREEPYVRFTDEEYAATARLAATTGLAPREALAVMPGWCAPRLMRILRPEPARCPN